MRSDYGRVALDKVMRPPGGDEDVVVELRKGSAV
jgi:hypothetical protein